MKFKFSSQFVWQIIEKCLRMLSVSMTSILITNQLGLEKFGSYSFIINNLLIMLAFANFGTANFVSSEAASCDARDSEVLGTFFYVRLFTSLVSSCVVYFAFLYLDYKINFLFFLFVVTLLLSSLDVFENFNIGKERYVLNLKIKSIILLLGFIIRVYFSFYDFDLNFYLHVFFFEFIFSYLFIFVEVNNRFSINLRFNRIYLDKNLRNIVNLSATSVLALLTVRVDQYLLKFMVGSVELGIYNFLFGFINVSTFLPLAVFYTKLPILSKSRELTLDHQKEHKIALRLFFFSGLVGSLVSFFVSSLLMIIYDFDQVFWFVCLTLSFLPLLTASSLYQVILIMVYDYKGLGLMKVLLSAVLVVLIGPVLVKVIGVNGVSLSMIIALVTVEIFFIANVDEKLRAGYIRMKGLK